MLRQLQNEPISYRHSAQERADLTQHGLSARAALAGDRRRFLLGKEKGRQ